MPFKNRTSGILAGLTALMLVTSSARSEETDLMTRENLESWEALLEGNAREIFRFDKEAREIRIDATGTAKAGEVLLGDDEYGDFKVECVFTFNQWEVENKYSGFNIYLRDSSGDRYWVYVRPNPFDMYAVKMKGGVADASRYDEGKKLHRTGLPALVPDQDYTLTVEMRGNSLAASLDGQDVLLFEDPDTDAGTHLRGRIGVGAESSDVTIKSLKVSNLENAPKLSIQSYTVEPAFEKKKHPTGRELTDGQQNQLTWRKSRHGEPVIVLDLGREYNVRELRLKAEAAPGKNISTYRVLGSPDGQKWDELAQRTNPSKAEGVQAQVLTAQLSGSARYVKLILFYGKDRPEIALDEVEIFGSPAESNVIAGGPRPAEENTGAGSLPRKFPSETDTEWYLGDDAVGYEISKKNGQVTGVWDVESGKRVLVSLEGNYYLEDPKSTIVAQESGDKVSDADFSARDQVVELTCTNEKLSGLTIGKRYQIRGNKLFLKTSFVGNGREVEFITYNVTAKFDQNYRDTGFYMGGGDGGWPLVPAPQIDSPQKVTSFRNTTKGMVLSQPDPAKGKSFAHVRTRLDETFVWPWFTGAIASYCEKYNILHYTPDGWDMSLGTSKLTSGKPVSFEQFVCLFPGDWNTFLTQEYPSLPEVKSAYAEIPPTPAWVKDIKTETRADIERVKQLLETTDEGNIMVIVDVGGSWADYYVDQGLEGGWVGGTLKAQELKAMIADLKALSPRVKVGLYMWVLSTFENTRIFKKHPEFFRVTNKEGEEISTFPGVAPNYAHLLSNPECYAEILSQFDLVLSFLGTDFIYLDDPKAVNLIDWKSGSYTRDDLSFKLYLDIKRLAAKHGPDKMVFFNNMCNPYGDVNYIEGRGELNADYWRLFAGNVAIAETNLQSLPDARIVLLYYFAPYEREYMNRVLAMGWIPEMCYGDVVERRLFIQAAYEVGNAATIPAVYAPDWKRDKDTNIESYSVRRNGDAASLLSFISHEKTDKVIPIEIDLASLNLEAGKRVFVWQYVIEDANAFRGWTSDKMVKDAYRESGWQLDKATRRSLVYDGSPKKDLALGVEMQPLLLYQLYVTNQMALVYSEDQLAANYLFSRMPDVSLHETIDWKTGEAKILVDSQRKEAEILLTLPLSSTILLQVSVNGEVQTPSLVWEGDDVFPLVRVAKGQQEVNVRFAAQPAASPLALDLGDLVVKDRYVSFDLPDYRSALVTISVDGRVLFNRMVEGVDGKMRVPLEELDGKSGAFTVQLRAVADAAGVARLAESAPREIDFDYSNKTTRAPTVAKPMTPGSESFVEVNKTVRNLEILKSAAVTTEAIRSSFQPGLSSLTARVEPENLLVEAGTTRSVQENIRGAAFAGLEIKNLRKVEAKLSNTFHDAFHILGKGHHAPIYTHSERTFAGMVVDYHTPQGYTKRVCFPVGIYNRKRESSFPSYGKNGLADEVYDMGESFIESSEASFVLDLQIYAPPDWDGQVWLSVGTDWVASDRRLTLQILGANDEISAKEGLVLTNSEDFARAYNEPKSLKVPRSPGGLVIDGVSNEEWWREGVKAQKFFLQGGKGVSDAETSALLLYDDDYLYVAFTCKEPGRKNPLVVGSISDGDEVEVWLDIGGDGKSYHQIIVNPVNDKLELTEQGAVAIGVQSAAYISEGDAWSVEMAIPFKGLGVSAPKPGDTWRISLCRYRPSGKGFNTEQIVWAPLKASGFRDLENFGTLIFE